MQIVGLLAGQPECAGSDIFSELSLAQSTVSQHLRVLREAGVIRSHQVGSGGVYCLDAELVRSFCAELSSMVAAAPACPSDNEESS